MKLRRLFGQGRKRPRVTLVLGGGSARGFGHVGVLKVLERERIPIDTIVGTSMGSLVGAVYGLGIPIMRMEEKMYRFTVDRLVDFKMPRLAILEGKKMEHAIADLMEGKGFSDMKIPLYVIATDIEANKEVILSSGDLVRSIRASCSWPGVFKPVEIGGTMLVDGGLKNSVPTRIAKELGGEFIIASDVGFCVKHGRIDGIIPMLIQTFQIMGEELNRYQANLADVAIRPQLGDIDQAAFHRAREAVIKGEEAAAAKIPEIRAKLEI